MRGWHDQGVLDQLLAGFMVASCWFHAGFMLAS
jgi:hypothetical protein